MRRMILQKLIYGRVIEVVWNDGLQVALNFIVYFMMCSDQLNIF